MTPLRKKVSPPGPPEPPKPLFGQEYGWARISHEAQIIDYCKKMGGIELKPPKEGPGFRG